MITSHTRARRLVTVIRDARGRFARRPVIVTPVVTRSARQVGHQVLGTRVEHRDQINATRRAATNDRHNALAKANAAAWGH